MSTQALRWAIVASWMSGGVTASAAGDTVRLAVGTYKASGAESVVSLPKDLTLEGGWDAAFASQAGLSTLDGKGARRGLGALHDLTIDASTVSANQATADGGGLRSQGTARLGSATLADNRADAGAGRIVRLAGAVQVRNTVVGRDTAPAAPDCQGDPPPSGRTGCSTGAR